MAQDLPLTLHAPARGEADAFDSEGRTVSEETVAFFWAATALSTRESIKGEQIIFKRFKSNAFFYIFSNRLFN